MSVVTTESTISYIGNASTVTPYTVPYYFLEQTDIKVVVKSSLGVDTQLVYGSGYSVSGAGSPSGGSILTAVAWANTYTVTIYREVPLTQLTVYEENADFPAKTEERGLDKLTMAVQQNARAFGRSFRVRESDGNIGEIALIPSTLIGLDAGGAPRAMTQGEVAVWLNIVAQYFGQGIKVFLNSADRLATVPDYVGQVGSQVDDFSIWTAHSLTVGDWGDPSGGIATGSIITSMLADGILSADTPGRVKMADGYITLAKIAAGIFTADAAGRDKFAAGFVNAALCASGLWLALAPNGTLLQRSETRYTSNSALSTVIPSDSSIPTNTEGTQILSVGITPQSATNKIRIFFTSSVTIGSSPNYGTVALFNGGSSAIAANVSYVPGGGSPTALLLDHTFVPGSTSPLTLTLRAGANTGNLYFNGYNTGPVFTGIMAATLILEEIKA